MKKTREDADAEEREGRKTRTGGVASSRDGRSTYKESYLGRVHSLELREEECV